LAHWGIAVVVIANYAFTKEGGSVHIALGWAGMALLLLRLIWGFVGPREARFASFPPNPMAALRHLGGLRRGTAPPYPSHNPAGALMAYALWACLAVLMLTGLGMSGLSPFAQADLEAASALSPLFIQRELLDGREAFGQPARRCKIAFGSGAPDAEAVVARKKCRGTV
jgi:cytochrome b